MLLQPEAKRILDFVSRERIRLAPHIHRLARERSSTSDFVELVNRFFQSLDAHLGPYLDATVALAEIQAKIASEALDDLFKGLETTLSFFSGVAATQSDIPRELYDLASWFFDRSSGASTKPAYIFTPGSELATLDFRRWIEALFPGFAALKATFANWTFFVIFIPSWMVPTRNSLDWPLIFHECAHAVENLANIVSPLFPYLPGDWPTLNMFAKQGNAQAQEALLTYELVCDFLATYLAGPIFVWRFLKDHFSISRVLHQSYTHPTPDLRIRRLVVVLRNQGFEEAAQKAESAIASRLGKLKGLTASPVVGESAARAQRAYQEKIKGFDFSEQTAEVNRYSAFSSDGLTKELLGKRPVLLSPACLFTLVAFEERCEDPDVAELLADCIRLYRIKMAYQEMNLHG